MRKIRHRIWPVMAVFMIMVLLCGCGSYKRVTKQTDKTTMGIDVARYQGTIDWSMVAGSNVDFAMIRIGYRGMEDGVITADCNGRYNMQEASAAGIPIGVYFFSTAITEEEAREEAQWVLSEIAKYPITYPVVYDCEGFEDTDSRQYFMSKEERTDAAIAFLETITEAGYEAMFYGSKTDLEWDNKWQTSRIERDYKIWLAQYPTQPYPATPESSYSGVHHMWQYSMAGEVPGIRQPVDMNIAYFGYDGIEPARDKEPPEEAFPDVEAILTFREVQDQVTAKEETNLRDIPSQDTDAVVLRTLKHGEIAQRIAESTNGWSKLVFEGQTYYAVSSYLEKIVIDEHGNQVVVQDEQETGEIQTRFYETNQTVTAKEVVNLRSLPSVERSDVQVIAQLKNGEVATCIGVSDNGWSKLNYRGTICYAISSYLMETEAAADLLASGGDDGDVVFLERRETVAASQKVNLRSRPSTEEGRSEVLGQLQTGDTAIRIGLSGNGWSKLNYNGTVCYAVSRYLTLVAEGETVQMSFEEVNQRVTAKEEVNLRTMPSVDDPACEVEASLKNGTYVTRTGINRDLGWSRILYNGKTLYCVSNYLTTGE